MVLTGTLKLRTRVRKHDFDPGVSARHCAGIQPPNLSPHTAGLFNVPALVFIFSIAELFASLHLAIHSFKKRKKTVIDKISPVCKKTTFAHFPRNILRTDILQKVSATQDHCCVNKKHPYCNSAYKRCAWEIYTLITKKKIISNKG
jgi:hypothetical protein